MSFFCSSTNIIQHTLPLSVFLELYIEVKNSSGILCNFFLLGLISVAYKKLWCSARKLTERALLALYSRPRGARSLPALLSLA